MIKLSLTRSAIAAGGLALALTAGAGVASADPNLDVFVNTTCTYDQAAAALNAQDPATAEQFNSNPQLQNQVRMFLAAPPPQRMKYAKMVQNSPQAQQYIPLLTQVFSTCNNY